MRAMMLREPGAVKERDRLALDDIRTPVPERGELLVRVSVCAVCRTDLDITEGRLRAPHYPLVLGHQIVGVVAGANGTTAVREGDRVGIAWIHSACGHCRWCLAGTENLCPQFQGTGCDANGGYAEYTTVPAAFAHSIPNEFSDVSAAPLLCAGAIGWRALRIARPVDGEPLGLTGFGASGHLTMQLIRYRWPKSPVYVFARSESERAFARALGAAWAGDTTESPPQPLLAIIDTTPAWTPVVEALKHLSPGGRLVINAIRKESGDRDALASLDYPSQLWMEREIKSVANVTRRDVREFLDTAADLGLKPQVDEIPLERANEALAWLRSGAAIRGSKVLRIA